MQVHTVKAGQKWQGKATALACYRCGGDHMARDCRFINEKCHGCGKKGHVKKMCRYSPPPGQQLKGGGKHKQFVKGVKKDKKQPAHHISEFPKDLSSDEEVFTMHNLSEPKIVKTDPITTQLKLNGNMVTFEVDTGCSVTIVVRQNML